jgi:transposase
MNRDKIENDLDASSKLEEALQINKSLAIAYYLGDELKFLWGQMSKEQCKKALGQWVAKSLASGIKMLISFANTLLAHRNGIFNWYDHKISSGPLEGLNNKIKVMKRQAYGFRDKEFLVLYKSEWVATN